MPGKVAQWLQQLGLGQYAAAFEAHDIDWELLADIDNDTLKDIGMQSAGHRLRTLKAIAGLRGDGRIPPGSGAADASDPGVEEDLTSWTRKPGERKPVTLLFADIVGSTALTEKLDPEEAYELLYRATDKMCHAVDANRGTICRFLGDGVMAMFGAPMASERHALEACKAALAMQAEVGRYSEKLQQEHGVEIQIRVGLHSGEVVVLQVGDDPDKPEFDASGPTVPLAARMEQAAAPGSILITESTRQLAGELVETREHPPVDAKGLSEPVEVFRLHKVRSPGDAPGAVASRPIVGRMSELAQFRGMLRACIASGHGQTALIRGEPGIGKTRLTEEMIRLAGRAGFACFKVLVLDFGAGKGQEAIPSLVRSLLGISQGSSKRDRQRALELAQRDGIVGEEQRVYLNDLLDLRQPLELRTLYDAMEAKARVDGKRKTVAGMLRRLAARQPVLLVVEGLHWADASTLEYVAELTATMAECPALMLLTTRLEGDPIDFGWRARVGEHPSVIWELGPLRGGESMQMAIDFLGREDDFTRQCIARAEGNPLFLEQLLIVAEKGNFESVPDSIKSLVLARIDQLESLDKIALRAASVLGQRFEPESLRHLIARPDYDCRRLQAHHLVRPDDSSYMFAHAMIQAGVYASLLKNQRCDLHYSAAQWFGDKDIVLYAEHLDRAGDTGAADAYLEAAQGQAELYRPERALQLAQRGLEIAPEEERFALLCLEGELLRIHGDVAESIAAYRKAAGIAAGEIGRCNSWIGVAEGLAAGGAHRSLLEVLNDAREIAIEQNLLLEQAQIYRILGSVLFYRGEIEACLEANKSSLDFAREAGSAEVEALALSGLANAEYNRGRFLSAQQYFDHCLGLAREQGFGRVIAANMAMRSYVICWQNRLEEAIAGYREAAELAAQISDPRAEMMALMIGGSLWPSIGDIDEGEKWLKRGLEIVRRIGAHLFEGVCYYLLGRFALLRGDRERARKLVQEGIAILRDSESGMTFGGPIALGILALAAENPEQCFKALLEGEEILAAGSVGHTYLVFYEDAMEACLQIGAWRDVERYASALVEYTLAEPLPRSDYFIARGRALAAHGAGKRDRPAMDELRRIYDEGERIGLKLSLPAIEAALGEAE